MNPENIKNTIQAVIDGITPLAEKLQMPLEKVFGWAVRQNYVWAISEIIGLVALIGLAIAWVKLFKYGKGKDEGESSNRFYNSDMLIIICVTLGVGIAVAFIIYFVVGIPGILSRLINPEFMALKDILNMLK